jgi:hypothetical protein
MLNDWVKSGLAEVTRLLPQARKYAIDDVSVKPALCMSTSKCKDQLHVCSITETGCSERVLFEAMFLTICYR